MMQSSLYHEKVTNEVLANKFLESVKQNINVLSEDIKKYINCDVVFEKIEITKNRFDEFSINLESDNLIEKQKDSLFYGSLYDLRVTNWGGNIYENEFDENDMIANFSLKLSYKHFGGGSNGCDFLYWTCIYSNTSGWEFELLSDRLKIDQWS